MSSIYLNPELQLPVQAHKYANYCLRSTALLISPGLVVLPTAADPLRPGRVLQWASLRGSLLPHGPGHLQPHGHHHPRPHRLSVASGFSFFVCMCCLSLRSHCRLLPLKRGEESEMEQCLSKKGKGWKNLQLAQLLDTAMLKGMCLTHLFSWSKVMNVKQKMLPVLHRHGTGFFLLCFKAGIVKKSFMWIGVRDVIWCCKTGGSGSYPQTLASDRLLLLSVIAKVYDRKELAALGWQPGENFLLYRKTFLGSVLIQLTFPFCRTGRPAFWHAEQAQEMFRDNLVLWGRPGLHRLRCLYVCGEAVSRWLSWQCWVWSAELLEKKCPYIYLSVPQSVLILDQLNWTEGRPKKGSVVPPLPCGWRHGARGCKCKWYKLTRGVVVPWPTTLVFSLSLFLELFLLQIIWLQLFCSSEAEMEQEGVLKLSTFSPISR